MALTKQDKEFIKSSMALVVREQLEPVIRDTQTNREALFGPQGNNGLKGDVKEMRERVKKLYWYVGVGVGIVSSISVVASKLLQ